jgi:hypothetical protein
MAAFTRANPLGWSVGNPVTSAQMHALDLDHVKAPNFVDGLATYNPAGLIQIGGAGMRFNAGTLFFGTSTTTFAGSSTIAMQGTMTVSTTGSIVIGSSGEISVTSGGEINLESGSGMTWADGSLIQAEDGSTFQLADGSVINFGGIVNFGATAEIFGDPRLANAATLTAQSGSAVTLASGSTLTAASGSTVTAAAGSTVSFSGSTTFANSTNPQLSPARTWTRRSLRICKVGYDTDDGTTAPEGPHAWVSSWEEGADAQTSSVAPHIRTSFVQTSGHWHWIELTDLPVGGTITEVTVTSYGVVRNSTTNTNGSYKVVRWNTSGTVQDMSASTPDVHDISSNPTWEAVEETDITITAHSTISPSYRYAVIVTHPFAGGMPGASIAIMDVKSTGTLDTIPIG